MEVRAGSIHHRSNQSNFATEHIALLDAPVPALFAKGARQREQLDEDRQLFIIVPDAPAVSRMILSTQGRIWSRVRGVRACRPWRDNRPPATSDRVLRRMTRGEQRFEHSTILKSQSFLVT